MALLAVAKAVVPLDHPCRLHAVEPAPRHLHEPGGMLRRPVPSRISIEIGICPILVHLRRTEAAKVMVEVGVGLSPNPASHRRRHQVDEGGIRHPFPFRGLAPRRLAHSAVMEDDVSCRDHRHPPDLVVVVPERLIIYDNRTPRDPI